MNKTFTAKTNSAVPAPSAVAASPTGEKAHNYPTRLIRRNFLQWLATGLVAVGLPCPAFADPTIKDLRLDTPFWPLGSMDTLDAIHTRRSIRNFTGEPVPQEVLQAVLSAGMAAPSAKNTQPWEFVLITKPETIALIPRLIPYATYTNKASAVIMACAKISDTPPGKELGIISVACAVQNMLLATHALGYGAVWIQIYPEQGLIDAWSKILNLPEGIVPICLVPMGKPVDTPLIIDRRNPQKIHHETW